MDRLNLPLLLSLLFVLGAPPCGLTQEQQVIDALNQQSRPARGRGPFPSSAQPGHSAGLPIRIELQIPTRKLQPNGTIPVDFIITNIGRDPIRLPLSVHLLNGSREALTLWLTSDAINDQYFRDLNSGSFVKMEFVPISAELDETDDKPGSFSILAPNHSVRVHASSPQLKPGRHSFTAHAELLRVLDGHSELIGTADSVVMKKILFATNHAAPDTIEVTRDVEVTHNTSSSEARGTLHLQDVHALPFWIREGQRFQTLNAGSEGSCQIAFKGRKYGLTSCPWLPGFTDHQSDIFKRSMLVPD